MHPATITRTEAVQLELGDRGQLTVLAHCSVRCPSWAEGCTAEPWASADLAGKLSPEANLFYLQRVHEMYLHLERREQARREEAGRQARERAVDDVRMHRERIADLLVLKCPNCDQAFNDVDGCNAVTCRDVEGRRLGCGTIFCFVCFKGTRQSYDSVHHHSLSSPPHTTHPTRQWATRATCMTT